MKDRGLKTPAVPDARAPIGVPACAAIALALAGIAVAAPAYADAYPVRGNWGVSASTEKGPIDCKGLRVIGFNGDQRTDSKGGVPSYRNRTVQPDGPGRYRVVDEFTTGQIANAHVDYTLHLVDDDRLDMDMRKGGALKLRKCK